MVGLMEDGYIIMILDQMDDEFKIEEERKKFLENNSFLIIN